MTVWTCNACGFQGKTSKEHLIHVAVGRVILANKALSPESVREHLQDDEFKRYGLYASPSENDRLEDAWINGFIRGLICKGCNEGWARRLEEEAGANLYDFTILGGAANAEILRRWAWYFAMKLRYAHSRPEGLADGPLLTVLPTLADAEAKAALPVVLARLTASPRVWRFSAIGRGWAGADTPFISWIVRGVVWMVVVPQGPKVILPIPTTPLVDGLRLYKVPTITKKQVVGMFTAPPASFERG